MDKLIYISMTGAKNNMNSIAVRANNLANTQTTAFKADFEQARSQQAFGEGLPTRVFAQTERPGQNFDGGAIITTERELDIAVDGQGWIGVLAPNGQEGYTRDGNLKINENGLLETGDGFPVIGDDGPIAIPLPVQKIEIGRDGIISVLPEGAPPNALEEVGRIKLVNPELKNFHRLNDGLFYAKDGQPIEADANVRISSGMLESSNVSVVEEMTHMISLQRQFEMQVKMIKSAEEIDSQHTQTMRLI
ncbi:flagellar basal body rod protein FlgF [Algicola sagamiensis]|uniref:flagellar basal body rod protein FlgF n=1 Tax=Algicola sagamiensis TaxID=163869 RepID=UPI000370F209|nr:flagellar basal body rod protein FlgF [Algicola sagamiensis]